MAKTYTEEKFKVRNEKGRMVEVVYDNIPDEDTRELVACLRIQEVSKGLSDKTK